MVSDSIIQALASFLTWVLGQMPSLGLPTYITGTGAGTLSGTVSSAVQAINGFGNYLPASQIVGAVALAVGGITVAVVVKIVRIIASFLTAGGGSAA